jgi:tetratricopeptide (TPR) repeat protein
LLLSGKDSLLKLREHSVLLFDNQPAQTLRDRYHFGPEVVEVAIHDLEFLNRDLEELLQAAEVALNNADPSPDLILKVLALLGSHPRTGKPSDSVRRFEEGPSMVWGPLKGLALYRAGRFEEARADLLGQVSLDLDKDRTEKCELLLAMTEFKLGQLSQANEWLKQVKNADFLRDRLDGGMGALEPEIKQLRAELLAEAENLILENGFPADPFAR